MALNSIVHILLFDHDLISCHNDFAVVDFSHQAFCLAPLHIYSKTSIIRSARDCRNFFELSVVRISEIGSFRICSDFFYSISLK